jgi:hypothetical protein
MDLQEVECGGKNQIDVAEDRARWRELVHEVMKSQVP